jgi:pyrophosphate--fructose-6-phosphate 1-phosphotransferase
MSINLNKEAERLNKVMGTIECLDIFVSEGACADAIVAEMKSRGETRKGFGTKEWMLCPFCSIQSLWHCTDKRQRGDGRKQRTTGEFGVIGRDEEQNNQMECIDFQRIKGGKSFDVAKNTDFINCENELVKYRRQWMKRDICLIFCFISV